MGISAEPELAFVNLIRSRASLNSGPLTRADVKAIIADVDAMLAEIANKHNCPRY